MILLLFKLRHVLLLMFVKAAARVLPICGPAISGRRDFRCMMNCNPEASNCRKWLWTAAAA